VQSRTGNRWIDNRLRLRGLVSRGTRRFLYVYDFGDDWRHDVVIEKTGDGEAGVAYPAFVAGARRCPPEDVGGIPGFLNFLDAMEHPSHTEHRRMLKWCGGLFDPEDYNPGEIRRRLQYRAYRRRGVLRRHGHSLPELDR